MCVWSVGRRMGPDGEVKLVTCEVDIVSRGRTAFRKGTGARKGKGKGTQVLDVPCRV